MVALLNDLWMAILWQKDKPFGHKWWQHCPSSLLQYSFTFHSSYATRKLSA